MIYLDNNSTTMPFQSVITGMKRANQIYGNPSSQHSFGQAARRLVENARESVSNLIGAQSRGQILFTSGATESIVQAFYIAHSILSSKGPSFIISTVEHTAVMETAFFYSQKGVKLSTISVDQKGNINLDQLEKVCQRFPKSFVSIMIANNETGVIFPIHEIIKICRHYGALVHIDAVQAIGKSVVDVRLIDCDFLSLSAHKFHGPKGTGALFIKYGIPGIPLHQGHQEFGLRGGTENVQGIVGMGIAAEKIQKNLKSNIRTMKKLRDSFEALILKNVAGSLVNGDQVNRLCNTSNVYFPKKNASELVERLSRRGVYVSSGAACTTGNNPSHVLKAMGFNDERANGSLRISLSSFNNQREILKASNVVRSVVGSILDEVRTL